MRGQMIIRPLIAVIVLGVISISEAQPVGLWAFNNAGNLVKATLGNDLILNGAGQSSVAGIIGSDGAVAVESGTYYQCDHGIAANGGGSWVNEFTLLFDVMYPQQSAGKWRAFYQSNWSNSNDADYFIHPSDESWGVGALGYTDNAGVGQWHSSHSTWYRAVLTVNLDNNSSVAFHDLYINGQLKGKHSTASLGLDGRFSLYSSSHATPYLVLSGDDSGEDARMHFSNIAIWDRPLTPVEIAELGGPGDPILANHPRVTITESDDTTSVTEGGGPDDYTVVLHTIPSASVQIHAAPSDEQIDLGAGPGEPVRLDFTTGDWDKPQTVHVSAVDDDVYEGKIPHTTAITHTAVSEDEDYGGIDVPSVEVGVVDDELTCGDWGYLRSDLNKDCYVDFVDFALLVDLLLER